jgi:preprotein translocase subunit SecA
MMDRLGIEENEPIIHPWISRAIENAQKRVEGHNFDLRKHLLEYDDVLNQQRKTVYGLRREFLASISQKEKILDMIDEVVTDLVEEFVPEKESREVFDTSPVEDKTLKYFDVHLNLKTLVSGSMDQNAVGLALFNHIQKVYEEKEARYSPEVMRQAEKVILLTTIDQLWKDHLLAMDHLRDGIGLRGYGQKDPLLEYKREGYMMFQAMIREFHEDVLEKIFHIQIADETQVAQMKARLPVAPPRTQPRMNLTRGAMPGLPGVAAANPFGNAATPEATHAPVVADARIGRNDPCSCGSGKKYKKCCGA